PPPGPGGYPPAPGYPAPPGPAGYPGGPVAAPPSPVEVDPHRLGPNMGRLSSTAKKLAKAPVAVTAAMLAEGEIVECLIQGRVNGADGVAVLTNTRLLLVSSREWKPEVIELPVDAQLAVQGWQDNRTAALVMQRADQQATIDLVGDRPLAMELAQRIRARSALG
ncbi:MAG: hypothetical protein ACRD0U_19595, partial [Acidimicrobiales bacterium]